MLGTKNSNQKDTDKAISRGFHLLWRERGDHRGEVIQCTEGKVWITQEGDRKDYLLTEGKEFIVTRRGLVLAEGINSGAIKVIKPKLS